MSIQHPDEQLWNDIVQDDDLDRFFDDSEASLVARAEQHVRRTSAPWKRPGTIGLAIGLLITAGAAWWLLTQRAPDGTVATIAPPTITATSIVAPAPVHAPASATKAPAPAEERFATHVSTTSTSNRAALIDRADSLQRVVSLASDTHQTPSMLYTIGVLRHRAGQVDVARRALAEAEGLATQWKLEDLLDKIRREKASLPTR